MGYSTGILPILMLGLILQIQCDQVWPGEDNLMVTEDDDVVLTCRAVVSRDNGIRWRKNIMTIYQTWPPDWEERTEFERFKYSARSSKNRYTLTIHNIVRLDADLYTCELVQMQQSNNRRVFRIYISDSMELNMPQILEEDREYKGSCKIGYFHPENIPGDFAINVQIEGRNLEIIENSTQSCAYNENHCTISTKFTYTGKRSDQESELDCVVKSSSKIKKYSTKIIISYPALRVDISPVKSSFRVGDVLACSADSYPPARLVWKSASVSGEVRGKRLFIHNNMKGKYVWECYSSNYPNAEPSQIEFDVEEDEKPRDITAHVAVPYTLVVLCLMAVVIFLVYKYILRKRSTGSTGEEGGRLLGDTEGGIQSSQDSICRVQHEDDAHDTAVKKKNGAKILMKAPQCIIYTDDDDRLVPVTEVLDQLRSLQGPIVVVAIAGMLRTGKSYLMNRIAQQTQGFELSDTIEPKTKGIWIWVRPHPKIEGTYLVLLDTEGMGDPLKPKGNRDSWIFTLATLLSSTLINNVLGNITDDFFARLELVSELRKRIKINSSQDTGQDDDFDMYSPTFVVTVRDFSLVLNYDGNEISSDEYLEQALETTKGKHEHSDRKVKLRTTFKKRRCFVFDKPASRGYLKRLDSLGEEHLSPDFVEDLNKFCDFVYDECQPLKLPDGHLMDGTALATLIKNYTKAAGEYGEICVGSAFTEVKMTNEKEALSGAIKIYSDIMENRLRRPTNDNETFDECHARALQKANMYYAEKVQQTGTESERKLIDQIYKKHDEYEKQNERLTKKCGELLKRRHKEILENMGRVDYHTEDLQADLNIIRDELHREGIMEFQTFNKFKTGMEQIMRHWRSAEQKLHKENQESWLRGLGSEADHLLRQGLIQKEKETSSTALRDLLEKRMLEKEERRAERFQEVQQFRQNEEERLRREGLTNQADILREKIKADNIRYDEERKSDAAKLSRIKKTH